MTVPFIDLTRINQPYAADVKSALDALIESGEFVLGESVRRFEENFAKRMRAAHAIGVANGPDGVYLALLALGLQPGEEVICPVFGYPAAAVAIPRIGATPIFAEVDENFLIDPESVRALVSERTRAILAVHTFGRACNMTALEQISSEFGLHLIEDATHACGAEIGGTPVGSIGIAGIYSFYPSRNLGAIGDGGMIVTNNEELAARLRLYRDLGRDADGRTVDLGVSSRLEDFQAAVLDLKLASLDEDNADRIANADFYREQLNGETFAMPAPVDDLGHVYNMFVIRHAQRDQLRNFLKERLVETRVHYPRPLHLEPCFQYLGYQEGQFPTAERLCKEVLSLPINPGLSRREIDEVVHAMSLFAQSFPAAAK
ncbi:DegT/DnrJ/EryC1/StrS family aminotransferase [bacterium]|nr:DegT/DnrJ/EryC1/StrS family aminotransferase [bacterium]